jgi:hypothetical protein
MWEGKKRGEQRQAGRQAGRHLKKTFEISIRLISSRLSHTAVSQAVRCSCGGM